MPRRALVLVIAATSVSTLAQEQDPGQVPTFRTGVDAVLVDVVALDGDGNPVDDLTREDFEIREDGVLQEIATFDVTDWTSYVAAATGGGATGGPVNAFPRRFVFILNRQGANFEHIHRAKRALGDFVVESMADGDEAMVIDVGYSTKVVQEFRAVKEETIEAVRKISQMELDYPLGRDRAAGFLYRDLESLANSLASLPGRKVIILFSTELLTFAPPGSRATDQGLALERATEALNEANATVYTLDIRGPESSGGYYEGGLSPLATGTGGRYFRSNPTFEPALRRIGRENRRYYLLSYVSTNSERDGTYRKIDVRVSRAGVNVIARRGYYARARKLESTEDAEAPAAAAELPSAVEITTYLLPTGQGPVRVPLSVAFPRELLQGRGGSERTASIRVTNASGAEVGAFEEKVSTGRFFVRRNLDLSPGAYVAHVQLRSDEGEIYRASTEFHVPSGLGERFGLSSIVPVVSPEASAAVGDGIPILPTASVKRGESLHVLFQVFSESSDRDERARIHYRILDDKGKEVWAGRMEDEIALSGDPAGTPVLLSLPTRTLNFGRHRVEVRIEDPDRGRRATSDLEIRVR